ncbi:MAG: rhomboid family intramembrane serine protease [Promethearchaeota archaeon]
MIFEAEPGRKKIRPIVTYSIILINIIVYIFENLDLGTYLFAVNNYGLRPAEIMSGQNLITLLSSMFLHAGIYEGYYGLLHIFMNMYILFIFGDDAEGIFGSPLFLTFYLFCGIIAGLFHSAITVLFLPGMANIPTIGASGAIFGVMAAYALAFPKRRLMMFMYYYPVQLPALAAVAFLVAIEVMYSIFSITLGLSVSIANTAHVGGFIAGAAFTLIFKLTGRGPWKEKKELPDEYYFRVEEY